MTVASRKRTISLRAPEGRQATHEHIRKFGTLLRLLKTPMFRRALRLRVAAAVVHGDVPFEHDFASVIDVGANHGQFALFALHRFPHAQLHCFEPQPAAHAVLRRVLSEMPSTRLIQAALGSKRSGAQVMHVSRLDDSSSLLPITARYTTAFPGTQEVTCINVPVMRLDDALDANALPRPCLLKLDVQGYELEVLRGGDRVLRNVDEIFAECSFDEMYAGQPLAGELIAYLWAKGFALTGVFDVKRDRAGRCLQADLLFARSRSR